MGRHGLLGVFFFSQVLFSLVLGGLPVAGQAEPLADQLYKASLPALDQSETERKKVLRAGLESVIVRVSGQTDFRDNTVIREALNNPDAYLQQFAYASLSEPEAAALRAETEAKNRQEAKSRAAKKLPPGLPPTIRINLTFSPEAIKTLLRKAQLPIWPANRPSVLVWVVSDSGAGKQQLGQSDPAQAFLLKEGGRRGLPLMLPMNDLKDQVVLGVDRLWNLDQAAIAEAAQRYGEGSVLAGKVVQTANGEWRGTWLYQLKGQSSLFESSGDDFEGFLSQGISEVVKIQVQRYGVNASSTSGSVSLVIAGVDSIKDYANTLHFLEKLDLVKSLRVTGANGNVLYCVVELDGDGQMLRELIALGSVLVPDAMAGAESPEAPVTLHYHLAGP